MFTCKWELWLNCIIFNTDCDLPFCKNRVAIHIILVVVILFILVVVILFLLVEVIMFILGVVILFMYSHSEFKLFLKIHNKFNNNY